MKTLLVLTTVLVILRCARGPLGVTDIDIELKPAAAVGENPFPNGYLDWMDHGGGYIMVTLIAKNIPALQPPAAYVVWRFSDSLPMMEKVGTVMVNQVTGNATGFLNTVPTWIDGDFILVTQEDSGGVAFPLYDTLAYSTYHPAPKIPLTFPGFGESFRWKAALSAGKAEIDPVKGEILLEAQGLPELPGGFVYFAWTASEEGFALGDLSPNSTGSLDQAWERDAFEGLQEEMEHLSLFKISIRPIRGRSNTASCLTLLSGTAGDFSESAPSDTQSGGGHAH